MSEAARSINDFTRRILMRKRLLSLQDHLAISVLAGGMLSAAIILYVKLRPGEARAWVIALLAFGAVAAVALVRWLMTRAGEDGAAFEIDGRLGLEDRIATASSIIRQGGPSRAVEEALLEDAAARIKNVDGSAVAPYRFPKWYALGLLGVAALVAALLVPQKTIPGGEALLAERVDIESAGEQLEQAAKEVEQFVPPETVTASLAREQAELGRALRRSTDSRAEALKRLSELEGRIRERHDDLAETRADEIVSLAEKRLRTAIASKPAQTQIRNRPAGGEHSEGSPRTADTAQAGDSQLKDAQAPAKEAGKAVAEPKGGSDEKVKETSAASSAERRAGETYPRPEGRQEPGVDPALPGKPEENSASNERSQRTGPQGDRAAGQTPAQPPSDTTARPLTPRERPQEEAGDGQQGDQQKPEAGQEASNPLAKMAAEQAARAAPALSEELLKKAAQMRAGELKPEDIQKLAKAAEALARELAPIAQSKEFQQQLQQLARQIDPQKLEQVARELMSQESLMRELEAAARLLAQNRQARELAAGLARQFEKMQPPQVGQGGRATRNQAERQGGAAGRGSPEEQAGQATAENRIAGRGREDKLAGKIGKRDGGEYLFLQSRPDAGTARVPYSSAYPRYRREAERSVERSQIPANMRRVVRSYFDAINPDSGKKQ